MQATGIYSVEVVRCTSLVVALLDDYGLASDLTKMIQVSIGACGFAGSLISRTYFHLPWHPVAIVLRLQDLLNREGKWMAKPKSIASGNESLTWQDR